MTVPPPTQDTWPSAAKKTPAHEPTWEPSRAALTADQAATADRIAAALRRGPHPSLPWQPLLTGGYSATSNNVTVEFRVTNGNPIIIRATPVHMSEPARPQKGEERASTAR